MKFFIYLLLSFPLCIHGQILAEIGPRSITKISIREISQEFISIKIYSHTPSRDWGFEGWDTDSLGLPEGFAVQINTGNSKAYYLFEPPNQWRIYCKYIKSSPHYYSNKENLRFALNSALVQVLNDFSNWGYEPFPGIEEILRKENGYDFSIENIWLRRKN
ncbi:MAG: hypothetical protein AAFY45_34200 [Bacteroidota bacterium]